ncbi:F-box domain-containing protein [Mycena kentingensis (nom. inval.)]|nr:F-box domain-containing protein [Mycena kentingensis (nom. inval.)]
MMHTDDVPVEVWRLIFDEADLQTICAASLTSCFLHRITLELLVQRLVWRSPQRARQHLSTFWARNLSLGRRVHSLTLAFTPPLKTEAVVCDIHCGIFDAISTFRRGLRRLVLCGLSIPSNFFTMLNGLPKLQYLNARQCIVPRAPPSLLSPPPLQELVLVHLIPRQRASYSPYFVHLFPATPIISVDRYHYPLPPVSSVCAPTRLTLGAALGLLATQCHVRALNHFRLDRLEELLVLIPRLYYPPFSRNDPLGTIAHKLPQLKRLFAPLDLVCALARSGNGLEEVAVQGVVWDAALALTLVNDLQDHGHPLFSFALTLASWDASVLSHISRRLPALERLEILYQGGQPFKSFPETAGQHDIPNLIKLSVIHIHPFPSGNYDLSPTRGFYFDSPADGHASTAIDADHLSRHSHALRQVKLWTNTVIWVRNGESDGWGRVVGNAGETTDWSSVRPVAEDMFLRHPPAYHRNE